MKKLACTKHYGVGKGERQGLIANGPARDTMAGGLSAGVWIHACASKVARKYALED